MAPPTFANKKAKQQKGKGKQQGESSAAGGSYSLSAPLPPPPSPPPAAGPPGMFQFGGQPLQLSGGSVAPVTGPAPPFTFGPQFALQTAFYDVSGVHESMDNPPKSPTHPLRMVVPPTPAYPVVSSVGAGAGDPGVQDLNDIIYDRECEITALKTRIGVCEEQGRTLQARNVELQSQFGALEIEFGKALKEVEDAQKLASNTQDTLIKSEASRREFVERNVAAAAVISELKKEIDRLNDECRNLQVHLKTRNEHVAILEESQAALEAAHRDYADTGDLQVELNRQLDELSLQIRDNDARFAEKERECIHLTRELKEARQEVVGLVIDLTNEKRQEQERGRSRISQQQREIASLADQLHQARRSSLYSEPSPRPQPLNLDFSSIQTILSIRPSTTLPPAVDTTLETQRSAIPVETIGSNSASTQTDPPVLSFSPFNTISTAPVPSASNSDMAIQSFAQNLDHPPPSPSSTRSFFNTFRPSPGMRDSPLFATNRRRSGSSETSEDRPESPNLPDSHEISQDRVQVLTRSAIFTNDSTAPASASPAPRTTAVTSAPTTTATSAPTTTTTAPPSLSAYLKTLPPATKLVLLLLCFLLGYILSDYISLCSTRRAWMAANQLTRETVVSLRSAGLRRHGYTFYGERDSSWLALFLGDEVAAKAMWSLERLFGVDAALLG